jgi:hypothetical protein
MTPTEQAARWLADVPRYGTDPDDCNGFIPTQDGAWLDADETLAAIACHLAPGDDLEDDASPAVSKAVLRFWKKMCEVHQARIAALTATVDGLTAERDGAVIKRAAWELAARQMETERDTLRDRLARMEGALEFQEQQRRDAFARRHLSAPEDPHVYVLCERYGYGAVMDAASRLWARKDSMGAFYIGGCIGIKPGDTEDRSRS